MRVRLYKDEWYPILTVSTDSGGFELEVPNVLWKRYQKATKEFEEAHELIRTLYYAAVKG